MLLVVSIDDCVHGENEFLNLEVQDVQLRLKLRKLFFVGRRLDGEIIVDIADFLQDLVIVGDRRLGKMVHIRDICGMG